MVNRMIAATIAFLIAVISFAPNEACARSAGSGGAIGHGAIGLGASRSINRNIGPGLGWSRFSAHPFRSRNFALRRNLRLRRFWSPGVWPDGCLLDGSCYEVPGGAGPYDNGLTSSDRLPRSSSSGPVAGCNRRDTWFLRKAAVSEASKSSGAFRRRIFRRPVREIRPFARSLETTGPSDDSERRREPRPYHALSARSRSGTRGEAIG